MAEQFEVELVYGTAERQYLLTLSVNPNTTVRQAVLGSELSTLCPNLDLKSAPVGIFGKQIPNPDERFLTKGERIEVYRPLLADPKEVRRRRAAKAKAASGK